MVWFWVARLEGGALARRLPVGASSVLVIYYLRPRADSPAVLAGQSERPSQTRRPPAVRLASP